MEIVSLVAILVGPMLAVMATRWLDDRNAVSDRKMSIFRTLMRTRRSPTTQEHVGALNLIEIEFAGDAEVLPSWKALFQHFGTEHPMRGSERPEPDDDPIQLGAKRIEFEKRIGDERQRLLAKLLHAMAKSLKFRVEQLEIFEGGYLPQGWVDNELDSAKVRRFAVGLAEGRALLPIAVLDLTRPEGNASPDALPPTAK